MFKSKYFESTEIPYVEKRKNRYIGVFFNTKEVEESIHKTRKETAEEVIERALNWLNKETDNIIVHFINPIPSYYKIETKSQYHAHIAWTELYHSQFIPNSFK